MTSGETEEKILHKTDNTITRSAVVLKPGEGRLYNMGRITSVFKADGIETKGKYSISEWRLEAETAGPGAHSHDEDDVFLSPKGQ